MKTVISYEQDETRLHMLRLVMDQLLTPPEPAPADDDTTEDELEAAA